jgi:hypothetical protein
MNKKVKPQVILKYLWLLHTPKKVDVCSFIMARIRIRIRNTGDKVVCFDEPKNWE